MQCADHRGSGPNTGVSLAQIQVDFVPSIHFHPADSPVSDDHLHGRTRTDALGRLQGDLVKVAHELSNDVGQQKRFEAGTQPSLQQQCRSV